jgi:bacteriocin resistance YdeI/OmpD-like protein/uncharacterized protein DUF1905
MGALTFTTTLQARGPAAAIVNGHTWRTTVTRMGGEFLLGLSREVREPEARAAFDALPYSHRKEHARAVAESKREETRDRRVAKVLETLRGAA